MGKIEIRLYQARSLNLPQKHGYNDPACSLTVGTTTSQLSAPRALVPKAKNSSPTWNQKLQFDVAPPESNAYLYFQVFDIDDWDKQTKIGDAWISLEGLTQGQESVKWLPLQPPGSGEVKIGLVALNFETTAPHQPYPIQAPYTHNQTPQNYISQHIQQPPNQPQQPQIQPHSSNQIQHPIQPQTQNRNPPYPFSNVQQPPAPEPTRSPPPKLENRHIANNGLIRFQPTDLQRDFPHIAKGSFGVVFKGKARGTNGTIVIKDLEIQNQRSVEDWKKEIIVMSQNRSPYVVEVFGYCSHQSILTIVMEYMAHGDLYGVLHKDSKNHPLSLIQRMRMARHCALGLAFLHSNRVIHRDVKSMNILVTEDYACKLTDFGCAKLISGRQIFNTMNSGTPLWMSPEVRRGQYSFSADVYSLGLVLYELFEKKLPGWDQFQQIAIVPSSFQSESVVRPCLNTNPDRRPGAKEVVKVLDKMIHNVLGSVITLLPENEQEHLRNEAKKQSAGTDGQGRDGLELELMQLYKHLLVKHPAEVDKLISQAFQINVDHPASISQPPPYKSGNGRQSQAAPSQPQAPYGVGYAPSYQFAPSSGYTPAPSYGYQQAYYNPPPRYSGGIQVAPPSYQNNRSQNSSTEAPPPYHQKSDPENAELDEYLKVLTVSELRSILLKNNIEAHSITTSELINKIKDTCGASVLAEFRAANKSSYPVSSAPNQNSRPVQKSYQPQPQSNPTPSSQELQQAVNHIALYGDQNQIKKEAAILCLSDLLRGRMEGNTIRETVSILFENFDQSNKGYIGLQPFLEIYKSLREMCYTSNV